MKSEQNPTDRSGVLSSSTVTCIHPVDAEPQSAWDLCVSVWWKVLQGPGDLWSSSTASLIKSGLGAAFLSEKPHSNSVA